MKKSTFALSLLLAAGAWAGLAWADEATVDPAEGGDTPAAEVKTTTFTFSEQGYGAFEVDATATNANNTYQPETTQTFGDDAVKFTATKLTVGTSTGNGARWWKPATGNPTLRLHKNSTLTIAVPNGEIQSIEFKGVLNCVYAEDFTAAADAVPATKYNKQLTATSGVQTVTYTPETPAESFTFYSNNTAQFIYITVKYTGGEEPVVDEREEADIAFSQDWWATNVEAKGYNPPFYGRVTAKDCEFTSSNPEVATWDSEAWPNVTALTEGETTITAKFAGNEDFKPAQATLRIKVFPKKPVDALLASNMGEREFGYYYTNGVFTLDGNYFCLKATNYYGDPEKDENGNPKYDENHNPIIGSPVTHVGTSVCEAYSTINLKGRSDCKFTAKMAYNYFGTSTADEITSKYCQVVVKEVASEEEEGGNQGGISPLAEGDETPEEPAEEPADEWTVLPYTAEHATEYFKWSDVTIDLSAYDGKEIQLAFRYTSDETICGTWEINTIEVNGTDPLAPAKEKAMAEVEEYLNAVRDTWSLSRYISRINAATTVEEVDEIVAEVKTSVAGQILNNGTMVHVWSVGEKYAASVPTEAEGVSPWNLINELATTGAWVLERAAEQQGGIFAPVGEEYVVDYSFYIKNIATNLYVGKATAGEIIGSAATTDEAGRYVAVCTEGKVAIASNDDNTIFINWDETKGMIAGTEAIPYTITTDAFPTWKKEGINFVIPDQTYNDWGSANPIEELSMFTFYVPTNAKLSGMGNVSLITYDEYYNPVVLDSWSWEALQDQDPEPVKYTMYEYVYNEETMTGGMEYVEYEGLGYVLTPRQTYNKGELVIQVDELMFFIEDEEGNITYNKEARNYIEFVDKGQGDKPVTEGSFVVTPGQNASVATVENIVITPAEGNLRLGANYETCQERMTLMPAEGGLVINQWTTSEVNDLLVDNENWMIEPDMYILPVNITAAGSYMLYIPEGFFWLDEAGSVPSPETYEFFTVTGAPEDGINAIAVSREGKIYDLQGRELAAPAKGINIINGKKVRI